MRICFNIIAIGFLASFQFVASSAAADQKIRVEFDAPATNYQVRIQKVYQIEDELWVISRIKKVGDIGGAAITRVSDEIKIEVEGEPAIMHKVLGKSWNWGKDTKNLHYIAEQKSLADQIEKRMGKLVWQREKRKP